MLRIGKASLPHGLILAPMAGFTDSAMRTVAHLHGAEYSVTEMVSAKAVTYGDKKTFELARIRESEGAVGLQIFGSEPEIMGRAAEMLSEKYYSEPPCSIDINMGCPVHKVFSNGEGSALMRSPELIYRIVSRVRENTDLPVTVKLRAGVDGEHVNAVECALSAEAAGASLIAVHGRTRVQMYSGRSDPEIIRNVKQSLHIPVIANGDVTSAADAAELIGLTGADGIMIGRAAIGNPFIFSEIKAFMAGEEYTAPTLRERVMCAVSELTLATENKGEFVAVREARGRLALYLKGFRGAAALRAEINRAESFSAVRDALLRCIEE